MIPAGDPITWGYTVTNCGDYRSVMSRSPTVKPGIVYVSGDTNGNDELDLTYTG